MSDSVGYLLDSHVLIVGCGALGSNLASLCVRAGIGHVRLVEHLADQGVGIADQDIGHGQFAQILFLIADHHQGVVEAELTYTGIVEAHREAEDAAQLVHHGVEVTGDERHLSESDHHSSLADRRRGSTLV